MATNNELTTLHRQLGITWEIAFRIASRPLPNWPNDASVISFDGRSAAAGFGAVSCGSQFGVQPMSTNNSIRALICS